MAVNPKGDAVGWVGVLACPSKGATVGATRAADQCHLEESSIILILFSIPSIPLAQTCYSKRVKRGRIFLPFSQLSSCIAFLPFLSGTRGKGFVPFSAQTSGSLTESVDIKVKWRKTEGELGCREFKEILQDHRVNLQQIWKQFRSPASRSSAIIKRSSLLILHLPMIPIGTEPELSWTIGRQALL